MSEIDENFGRYLDSLVEPVEPEWVIGWVARRCRLRAVKVAGAALALAAVTGVVGYQLHPDAAPQVRFGADEGSSTTAASSTTTSSSSTSSSTSTTTTRPSPGPGVTSAPQPPAPPGPPTPTTLPPVPPNPMIPNYGYAQPGDATATTSFATSSLTVGVPVAVTVTVVNTRDYGVAITADGFGYGVYFEMDSATPSLIHIGFDAFAAPRNDTFLELAPHATVTATVSWTPTVSSSGSARLVLEQLYSADEVNVTQTPTPFTIAPAR